MEDRRIIIEKIFDHVENDDVDKAVFACLRLSRSLNDYSNTLIFLREIKPDKKQYVRAFYDEVKNLKKEAQEFLLKSVTDYWIEERTLDSSFTGNPEETVVLAGVGNMKKEVSDLKDIISDFRIPSSMEGYDLAYFTDCYNNNKVDIRLKIKGLNTILERIRTQCLDYASRIECQINAQEHTDTFLSQAQNQVNSYFSARSEDTYSKLIKATDLIGSNNIEDNALLLTSIRRAIHAAADYFYPPVEEEVICVDGKSRKLGNGQYINRLHEFVSKSFKKSASTELLKAELDYLISFLKKINEIASKGVHSNVTGSEAKQGVLGLYLFLFNIIEKLEYKES